MAQYIVTLYLCYRLRKLLENREFQGEKEDTESRMDGMLGTEDYSLALRVRQARTLILAFTINIVVGLGECILVSVPNKTIQCESQGISYLKATSTLGVVALYIKDFSQLVPHIFIPYILYVIPMCAVNTELVM